MYNEGYLGKVPVLKDPASALGGPEATGETVNEVMVGVRRLANDQCEEVPAALLACPVEHLPPWQCRGLPIE